MLRSIDTAMPSSASPRHIVHREDQWEIIDSEIRKRQSEPILPKSVIAMFGPAGIGKSTFFKETLYPRLTIEHSTLPIAKIDFDKEFVDEKYDMHLRGNVLVDLILELEKTSGKSAEIDSRRRKWEKTASKTRGKKMLEKRENDLVEAFLEFVSSLSLKGPKRPVIFMLDTVEQADRDVIGWIQEKLQAPTTDSGYVLWIMASRQPIDCQPFFLRPRYYWLPIEPFKEQQIQSQIPEHPELANAVQKLSFGLPAATSKIAEALFDIEKEQQRILRLPDLEEKQIKDRLILSLEDLLKLKHYFGGLENPYLGQALEILSPLRLFNIAIVTELLPKWLPEHFKSETIGADALYEIQKMVLTRLVSWDRSRRGYVFEEPLRRIVALILKHRQPERYVDIHRWAAEHYFDWSRSVEAKRLDYIVEALYHRLNVLLAEKDADLIQNLISLLKTMIEEVRSKDELNELKEQLESDRDFNSLLGRLDMEKLLSPLRENNRSS
jgi:hypothetical protein